MKELLILNIIGLAALALVPLGIFIRRLVDKKRLADYNRDFERRHGIKTNKRR